MNSLIRIYVLISQLALGGIGLCLLARPHILLGDNSYLIGVHFLSMMFGCGLLGLAVPALWSALRGHAQALKYILGGQLILHMPMPALFTYNIGAFDYAYETTGQTVATWMIGWIVLFGAPTLFCWLFLHPNDAQDL